MICKQAHGLTPAGWVHTKDGKPCKHMNAAHVALLAAIKTPPDRSREEAEAARAYYAALHHPDLQGETIPDRSEP